MKRKHCNCQPLNVAHRILCCYVSTLLAYNLGQYNSLCRKMVKCHGFSLARYIEVNIYSLSLLSNPISIFIPSVCRILLAYMYSPLSGHFFTRKETWAFFPYDQFAIHLLEVIPRQCSPRTLPSSDASAKPWVARPISVLQNFAILHCQSESTWNTFVGATSKMCFSLPMKLHFLSVRKEWTHLEANQIWQVFPLHVKSTRTSRCKSFANDSMDRWWSKRWGDNLWWFCFQVPTSLGWKNANVYTTGSQTSWKNSPLAIQEILQVLRDVSWNKELVVLFFSSIWNRLGDVDFMQTPIQKFKEARNS